MQSTSPASQTRSQRIVLARLLCIFGMIYVHVPLLDVRVHYAVSNGFFDFEFLRAFIIEGYGRTSACLLSVVSGYLVAKTLKGNSFSIKRFYQRRFKSIIVPMLLWGLLTTLVFSIVSLLQTTFLHEVCGFDRQRLISCINVVFHLTEMGQGPTMHLAFLRDLFVCMLLAPVLIVLLRQAPALLLVVLTVVYLLDIESFIILSPLVLLGFSAGILIGLHHLRIDWVDKLWLLWAGMATLMTLLIIAFDHGQLPDLQKAFSDQSLDAKESLLYPLSRFFGALTIWTVTAKLVTIRYFRISATLEPYLFFAFCAHPLMLSIMQTAATGLLAPALVTVAYPFWFVIAPAVVILVTQACTIMCSVFVPAVLEKITGGRWAATPGRPSEENDLVPSSAR